MSIEESFAASEYRKRILRCQMWVFVPVFGFFAFYLMADNSGEDRYRRLGRIFAIFSLVTFTVAVSGDLLIYFATLAGGMRMAAYARSVMITAYVLMPVIYLTQIIKTLTLRKDYVRICEIKAEAGYCTPQMPDVIEKIDINSCSKEDMLKLPGVDAAMALRIVKDRENRGGFSSVEELLDMYEIKPHFAARIEEIAYAGSETETEHKRLFGTGPLRAIDI